MTAVTSRVTSPDRGYAAPEPRSVPPFAVVSGRQVHDALSGRERELVYL